MIQIKPLLLVAFIGFSCSGGVAAGGEKPWLSCETICASQVAPLTDSALAGSAEDALKVFWYYADENDQSEMLFWAQVAMENGSDAGRHNYASLLSDRDDWRSLARAKFHLQILVKNGDKTAHVLLNEVDEKLARLEKDHPK